MNFWNVIHYSACRVVRWYENWFVAQIQKGWLPVWVLGLAVQALEFTLSLDLIYKLRHYSGMISLVSSILMTLWLVFLSFI